MDTENTVDEVRRTSWVAKDKIVYLQDLLKCLEYMNAACLLPGSGWGCNIDSVLKPSKGRNELRGQQLEQRENLMRRPEWYAPPTEVQKLNDLIKWRAETYTPLESLKPTAVAKHKKQQEEMGREAQQEQPNRRQPEVMATGRFNPVQPNKREEIAAAEYDRIQCEKRARESTWTEEIGRRRMVARRQRGRRRSLMLGQRGRAEGTGGVNLS